MATRMSSTKRLPTTQTVGGKAFFVHLDLDRLRKALQYQPGQGVIMVVTYPRCGSHWITQVIQLILKKGESAKTYADFARNAPFLEFDCEGASDQSRVIRTHLSIGALQFNDKAKYIYVARNPLDCCVSSYHITRELEGGNFEEGKFEDYLDGFLEGTVGYGDYFKHLDSGYSRRHEPNVFFTTYEELQSNKGEVISRLARFLGEDYGRMLEEHSGLMQNILDKSSIEFLKGVVKTDISEMEDIFLKDAPISSKTSKAGANIKKSMSLVRVGGVDSWKQYFEDEHLKKMRAKIEERKQVSMMADLWKHLDSLWRA